MTLHTKGASSLWLAYKYEIDSKLCPSRNGYRPK